MTQPAVCKLALVQAACSYQTCPYTLLLLWTRTCRYSSSHQPGLLARVHLTVLHHLIHGAVPDYLSAECCVCRVEAMNTSARRLPAVQVLLYVSFYSIACCATASSPSTSNSSQSPNAPPSASTPALASALSPASGPVAQDCELNTLRLLGWQQAYSPQGYTINTQLPSNCSSATWQALGCLTNLTSLTLTSHLPNLPDAWAANDSFPSLQAMKFSSASLAGTLPSSWAQDMAFPQLQTMDFSMTQLSGSLPAAWGQSGAFQQLNVLHLNHINIAGDTVYTHVPSTHMLHPH
jgi:hypothetical protein